VGDDPYENVFDIVIEKDKTVNRLEKVIKEKKKPHFDNFAADELKLWKVEISINGENDKLEILARKSYGKVNIEEELGGEKLSPLSRLNEFFSNKSLDEQIHIIVKLSSKS